jgi:hypothetical protein
MGMLVFSLTVHPAANHIVFQDQPSPSPCQAREPNVNFHANSRKVPQRIDSLRHLANNSGYVLSRMDENREGRV